MGPKQALFAEFASVARALGHSHRLEILELLAQGERGVDALAERIGLSVASAPWARALQHFAAKRLVCKTGSGACRFG